MPRRHVRNRTCRAGGIGQRHDRAAVDAAIPIAMLIFHRHFRDHFFLRDGYEFHAQRGGHAACENAARVGGAGGL